MKKLYLVFSVVAFSIPVVNFIILGIIQNLKEGNDAFSWIAFTLGTIVVAEIPLLFWIPASLVALILAISLPEKRSTLKRSCLAFPILVTLLIYTCGTYVGP